MCTIGIEQAGSGAQIVRVAGELDTWTAPTLQMIIDREVRANRVYLDLIEVSFIDLRGLRVIESATRWVPNVTVVAVSQVVARLFALAGQIDEKSVA
jgi:anti-anti-sigma factor